MTTPFYVIHKIKFIMLCNAIILETRGLYSKHALFRDGQTRIKVKAVEIEADNVKQILKIISEQYDSISQKQLINTLIFANGRYITELKLLRTALRAGDVVEVFYLAAGADVV